MSIKHPFQSLRYSAVREILRADLALTRRQAENVLASRTLLPPWEHQLHSQQLWLAKDVVDFVAKVKQGDIVLLGKGEAGGGPIVSAR